MPKKDKDMPSGYTAEQIKDKCKDLGFTGDADQYYTQWAAQMNHVPPAPVTGFNSHNDFYAWCAENFTGTL